MIRLVNSLLFFAFFSGPSSAENLDVNSNQDSVDSKPGIAGNPDSTGCGHRISDQDRVRLIEAGFAFRDANNLGYSFFSKMNYVYPDKIYAKHYNGEIWRMVYLGQPAIYKDYVGKSYTCGLAYGYPLSRDGGRLTYVNLGSIYILDHYEPQK